MGKEEDEIEEEHDAMEINDSHEALLETENQMTWQQKIDTI